MSAKGSNSVPNDRYYTPLWVVDQCIEHVTGPDLRGKRILEPSAGQGVFARAFAKAGADVVAVEPDGLPNDDRFTSYAVTTEVFVEACQDNGITFDMAGGNPPFTLAQKHVELLLNITPVVFFLLRLAFQTTAERARWLDRYRPNHICVLRHRPKFGIPQWWVEQRIAEEAEKGKEWKWGGDSADYGFFVWRRESLGNNFSTTIWLPEVPKEKRRKG